MIALQVGSDQPNSVKGILSLEGWTNHHVAQDAFQGNMYVTLSPAEKARDLEARRFATGHWNASQRSAFAQIWKRWNGVEFLEQTEIPILEVYGDRGRAKRSREALRIPRRENIQLRWILGASHSLPLERPREVAQLMMEFIRRVESK
jgi:pimeloyl-ACP methyl ester carboxylesterase